MDKHQMLQHMLRGGLAMHRRLGLCSDVPEPDEQPEPVELDHKQRTAPHGPAGGCDG